MHLSFAYKSHLGSIVTANNEFYLAKKKTMSSALYFTKKIKIFSKKNSEKISTFMTTTV